MLDSLFGFLQFAGAFLLVLGPLIVVHELGHFLAAKAFRIGVPVFSVGIGPRLFGIRRGETDYRVSAIPLGGYVRLYGDESDEQRVGDPAEFLSRPRYQRFIVFLAGPAVNIALALVLVWLVLWVWGVDEVPTPENPPVVVTVRPDSPAARSGVMVGDRVIRVEGQDARDLDTFTQQILLYPDSVKTIEVERDGERITIELQTGSDPRYRLGDPGWLVRPESDAPPRIAQVLPGPARSAGLQEGDLVVGAGGREPISDPELRLLLQRNPGREVLLRVQRDGELLEIPVTPREQDGRGVIGVALVPSNVVHREFSAVEAIAESFRFNLRSSTMLFVTLKQFFLGRISVRAFSGPLEIAQVSREMVRSGWRTALGFLAFISLQLGVLNLMPIPVLDGGHILILGVEGAMRRALSERLKERVMYLGLVVLLVFFVFVLSFDVLKLTAS